MFGQAHLHCIRAECSQRLFMFNKRALERQHSRPDIPYGLDMHRDGAMVLRVMWADQGGFAVAGFVRGAMNTVTDKVPNSSATAVWSAPPVRCRRTNGAWSSPPLRGAPSP